jgi:hypothetical protein
MSWVTWRQYRAQAAIAGVLLAAFAALILVTGVQVASQWHDIMRIVPIGYAVFAVALGIAAGTNVIPVTSLPALCQAATGNGTSRPVATWAFQGIETGIFLLLAAALPAITFAVIMRREA